MYGCLFYIECQQTNPKVDVFFYLVYILFISSMTTRQLFFISEEQISFLSDYQNEYYFYKQRHMHVHGFTDIDMYI